MSNPPPLPWCEPITHFNEDVFLVFLGLSDGFRWVLDDFGRTRRNSKNVGGT